MDGLPDQRKADKEYLDPIAHVAVAVRSLVVWAYCCFNEKGCARCIGPAGISIEVELMDILTNNEESEKWIELGGRQQWMGTLSADAMSKNWCKSSKIAFHLVIRNGDLAESLSGVLNKTS